MAIAVKEVAEKAVQNEMTPQEKRHLGALEKRIAAGLQTFREVGVALLEIRDNRLYRETHPSFEAYAAEKWGFSRGRADQLIDSAKVLRVLGDPKDLVNEGQARELVSLTEDPATARKVWAAVSKRADETKQPVTANLIRTVKDEVLHPNGVGSVVVSPTERLVQEILRLATNHQRWVESKPNVGQRQKVAAAMRKLMAATTPHAS